MSVVTPLAVLGSVCVSGARVQFNETQLDEQVDSGVDVHCSQLVLAKQFRWHEALNDVVAAAVEPARATFWSRQ